MKNNIITKNELTESYKNILAILKINSKIINNNNKNKNNNCFINNRKIKSCYF